MSNIEVRRRWGRPGWLSRPALSVGLLWPALSGCQALIDTSIVQCSTDQECTGLAPESVCGPDGVCQLTQAAASQAGNTPAAPVAPPAPTTARPALLCAAPVQAPEPGRMVTVSFTVFNYSANTIPPGIVARACERFDGNCATPLVDNVTLDAAGYARFSVPHGFDGYFELEGPNVVSSLVFHNRAFYDDTEFEGPALVSPLLRGSIAATGAVDIDTATGIVILEVKDCEGNPVDGVQVVQAGADTASAPFYFVDGLPDLQRAATVRSARLSLNGGERSVAGFAAVPEGLFEAEGRDGQNGPRVMGIFLQVRADWITYAVVKAGQ